MVLVDSSAWIDLMRARGTAAHRKLRTLIESDAEIATTGPVMLELLAGADSSRSVQTIRTALASCELLPVSTVSDWEGAAAVYLRCRQAGFTAGRFDCLIAAVALRTGASVLSSDRDFAVLSEHTGLELA